MFVALSHTFGRKIILFIALLLFLVGSIVAAVSENISVLLAGRCIQGVGSGSIIALSYIIVNDMVSLRERGKWCGIISSTHAIGSKIGPPVCGVFAQRATWVCITACI